MIRKGIDPESGTLIGSDVNIDPYKRLIALHFPAGRTSDILHIADDQSPERGERARVLIAMAEMEDNTPAALTAKLIEFGVKPERADELTTKHYVEP